MVTTDQLIGHGLGEEGADSAARVINELIASRDAASAWRVIIDQVLNPDHPFSLHRFLHDTVFADWDAAVGPRPAWTPSDATIRNSNIGRFMEELGISTYAELHRWSVEHRDRFWRIVIDRLGIRFSKAPPSILDLAQGVESPGWLAGARLNIVDSCFDAPADETAIVHQAEGGKMVRMSYGELESLTNRVANAIDRFGLRAKDGVAVCMPMTAQTVAIYLGIIRAGGVMVSIADSFAPDEIARRIRIAGAKVVFTQGRVHRGGKVFPMYAKIVEANAPQAVVLPDRTGVEPELRDGDITWESFLSDRNTFEPVVGDPDDHTNVLFSSGTTGDPKAIPWTQLAPIKCAADALLHQDVQPRDVLAWPTSLGWMMGPWLIYASLINRAAMALYDGMPTGRPFGEFVQNAQVTMLGLVPSLVRAWRDAECMKGLDWRRIKVFSSTGECSDADDMLYLMSLAGYRPVIEYCGGTEIGGGYITGTVVQAASPATFSTPALGLDVAIVDEAGREADEGELFMIPPSIGLSQQLINRDHHEVYFEGTPMVSDGRPLRRHGDHMQRLGGGYYRAHGRVDDTMNLGGIKVSSAEIERVVNTIDGVSETAAIGVVPPSGGPSRLVIYVVLAPSSSLDVGLLKASMQVVIRGHLNPLFKVYDVIVVEALPRTASNKVMRRELRASYTSGGARPK